MKIFQKTSYYAKGRKNRPPLHYLRFTPEKVKATLLIVHGMQEHSGRYEETAQYFAEQGLAVLAYDHLGHGKSVQKKKDLGYFQQNEPAEQLIADAALMGNVLREQHPDVPHFILGHSMGSLVTRCLLQQNGEAYDGIILAGTGGRIFGISLLKAYFSVANRLCPRRRTAFAFLFNYVQNRYFKQDEHYAPTSWLSLNNENRVAFVKDDLCGIPFTNNGFYTLFTLYDWATKKNWVQPIPRSLPFLFVSGGDDPIGNFGKGVKQSAEDLRQNDFNRVKVNLYPRMRHEILHEKIKTRVLQDITTWLSGVFDS